jgi:hypothetical protein
MTDGRHLRGLGWKIEERTFDIALLTFIRGNLSKRWWFLHVQAVRPRHPATMDDVFHQTVWSGANAPGDQRISTVAISQEAIYKRL